MDAFVSHDELNAKNYVDRTFANNSMSTPTLLPLHLSDGLLALEKDVKDPGGAIDRLIITLQDLKNRKAGEVVNVRPYTFKTESETDLWINTLGVSHAIGFAVDARVQLSALRDGFFGTNEFVRVMADTSKVGFASLDLVKLTATFKNVYPENIIRKVNAQSLTKATISFTADFVSCKHFKGDIQDSPLTEMLDKLEHNQGQYQAAIDAEFPPNQTKNIKPNAIFSWILRKGYNQARSFLNSIEPFYTMLMNAGLGADESWKKCFAYVKAVFQRLFQVRYVSKNLTPGAMLYGMLRATVLLDEYEYPAVQ